RKGLFVDMISESTVVAHTLDDFFAHCYLDAGALVGLARFSAPVEPELKGWARFQLMHATWVNATTLHVTWISPISGTPRAEETWTYAGGLSTTARTFATPGPDSLPKFGDFVYVEELPEAIQKVAPQYPTWAREKGLEGIVMVQALVGKDG